MQPDPEYLRRHYASLSDEALLDVDRADLVEVAQSLYDSEVRRRNLTSSNHEISTDDNATDDDATDNDAYDAPLALRKGEHLIDEPDWLEDASEVFSSAFRQGSTPAPEISTAREVLETAGIPCYLYTVQDEDEDGTRCRLMVPGNFNLRAASLLDKEIFNADFEADWKSHLQALSDEEFRDMTPREVFCGLFDRVERVTKVYNAELARRRSGTPE